MTKDYDCALIFFSDFCVIQELPTRNLIGVGRQRDGLYYFDPIQPKRVAMSVKKDENTRLWHLRLGHVPVQKIKGMQLLDRIEDIEHCDSCIKAKQTRLPFQVSAIKSKSCFELIHCDIWGKYNTATITGAHYFLTIVDDHSRGVWVYLMKHKSEVGYYLPMFCNMVKNQFGKAVKKIRADNGAEFKSNQILDFYKEQGIILQTSCTDTPQQNGVVERKHRHILEVARALRFQAGLPIRFWGECVLTATYLIN